MSAEYSRSLPWSSCTLPGRSISPYLAGWLSVLFSAGVNFPFYGLRAVLACSLIGSKALVVMFSTNVSPDRNLSLVCSVLETGDLLSAAAHIWLPPVRRSLIQRGWHIIVRCCTGSALHNAPLQLQPGLFVSPPGNVLGCAGQGRLIGGGRIFTIPFRRRDNRPSS